MSEFDDGMPYKFRDVVELAKKYEKAGNDDMATLLYAVATLAEAGDKVILGLRITVGFFAMRVLEMMRAEHPTPEEQESRAKNDTEVKPKKGWLN